MTFKPFSYAKKHILQLNPSDKNAILTLYSDTRKDKKETIFVIRNKKQALFL